MYQKARKSLYVSKGLFPDIAKIADFRQKILMSAELKGDVT